jgi:hypothetical protein
LLVSPEIERNVKVVAGVLQTSVQKGGGEGKWTDC